MPASANETTIAGPESPMPSASTTKMPVPMIAPTPKAVRSRAPTAFLRVWPSSLVSAISSSVLLRAQMLGSDATAMPSSPCLVDRILSPSAGEYASSERGQQALEVGRVVPSADGGTQQPRAGEVADRHARLQQPLAGRRWVGVLPAHERRVAA